MSDLLKKEGLTEYNFVAESWKYLGKCAWHFISLPAEVSNEIRENSKWQEEGWGRLKATAKIGSSEWKTSIWFDTKHEAYLLPLKAEIRKNEKIEIGQSVNAVVRI